MKLPKVLLSAIIAGLAIQAEVACSKSKENPAAKTTAEKEKEDKKTNHDPCPACGMG